MMGNPCLVVAVAVVIVAVMKKLVPVLAWLLALEMAWDDVAVTATMSGLHRLPSPPW